MYVFCLLVFVNQVKIDKEMKEEYSPIILSSPVHYLSLINFFQLRLMVIFYVLLSIS